MRNIILTTLLLLIANSAVAATVTVNATATILEPVKISYQNRAHDFEAASSTKALNIQSARHLQYALSRNNRDVCMYEKTSAGNTLAKADCRTVTINFN